MDWNKKQIFLCKSFGKKGISECCQVGAVAEHLTPNMESRSLKNIIICSIELCTVKVKAVLSRRETRKY